MDSGQAGAGSWAGAQPFPPNSMKEVLCLPELTSFPHPGPPRGQPRILLGEAHSVFPAQMGEASAESWANRLGRPATAFEKEGRQPQQMTLNLWTSVFSSVK